ncbi:MAG: nucleotidyltransferase domain-containing protein [Promethearchaeota archaeon]
MVKIKEIQKELKELNQYQVVIYGSYLSKFFIFGRSDIDIAIITCQKIKESNFNTWKKIMGKFNEKYDIKIFELLPLFIQIEVIEQYRVLFGDELNISEYFSHYRKVWNDMKYRIEANQFKSINEKIVLIEKTNKFFQTKKTPR